MDVDETTLPGCALQILANSATGKAWLSIVWQLEKTKQDDWQSSVA